jgi:hypothetical protein
MEELRASGRPVKDEDLARVPPLLRAHVIPNGSYDLTWAPRRHSCRRVGLFTTAPHCRPAPTPRDKLCFLRK